MAGDLWGLTLFIIPCGANVFVPETTITNKYAHPHGQAVIDMGSVSAVHQLRRTPQIFSALAQRYVQNGQLVNR